MVQVSPHCTKLPARAAWSHCTDVPLSPFHHIIISYCVMTNQPFLPVNPTYPTHPPKNLWGKSHSLWPDYRFSFLSPDKNLPVGSWNSSSCKWIVPALANNGDLPWKSLPTPQDLPCSLQYSWFVSLKQILEVLMDKLCPPKGWIIFQYADTLHHIQLIHSFI